MTIRFDAIPRSIGRWTIVPIPPDASEKLPSRGQVAIRGTINGREFRTVVEPDGRRGHWIKVEEGLHRAAGLAAGVAAVLDIEVTKDWPEPDIPPDLRAALAEAPGKVRGLWDAITPMARWEWVRWVNETKNPDTRQRRVEVTISKMGGGKRRPCCFDLSACTDPDLARGGKLMESQTQLRESPTHHRNQLR